MKIITSILKEHVEYSQQIFKLAKTDLVKTYRGAALGWSWAIIKPAITIFVYWFAFSVGLRISEEVSGYPFFLWLLVGIVPWFYMSDMLTQGINTLKKYSYLVTKMKYPISTIPTFVSLSKLSVHLLLMIIVILIFLVAGNSPSIYWVQIPFYILLMFIFFTICALFGSLLSAISKDFYNLVKSFVTPMFWLSGIIWNINTIEAEWLQKLLMLNPVTFLVEGFRNCFISHTWFFEQPVQLLFFVALTVMMLVLSIWAYKKLRKEIPDVL